MNAVRAPRSLWIYESTLLEWVAPERLLAFAAVVAQIEHRLKALRLN